MIYGETNVQSRGETYSIGDQRRSHQYLQDGHTKYDTKQRK